MNEFLNQMLEANAEMDNFLAKRDAEFARMFCGKENSKIFNRVKKEGIPTKVIVKKAFHDLSSSEIYLKVLSRYTTVEISSFLVPDDSYMLFLWGDLRIKKPNL